MLVAHEVGSEDLIMVSIFLLLMPIYIHQSVTKVFLVYRNEHTNQLLASWSWESVREARVAKTPEHRFGRPLRPSETSFRKLCIRVGEDKTLG